MSCTQHIAIDAMGGDGGVSVTVPAAIQALQLSSQLHLHLIGDAAQIQSLLATQLSKQNALRQRISVVHTSEQVDDHDKPTSVLRSAKHSSMYIAVKMVQDGKVQAMVSAGNTGALLMIGRHLLKTIAGIDKPAIVATIPGASKQSYLLDVGANLNCQAQQLFQFAVMGTVLVQNLEGIQRVRVGVLNIGVEEYKGTEQVKQVAQLLENCDEIDYVGYVEGSSLFEGLADVVICDGFVGNVTIKSSAGVANVVKNVLEEHISKNWLNRVLGVFTSPVIKKLHAQINPNRFNGASLLGLQGSIVKSHGNADCEGFCYAIQQAVREIEHDVPQMIAKKVATIIATSTDSAVT